MATYRPGDMVRIRPGQFAAFAGRIGGINHAEALLKVAVEIFGRTTPAKLKFSEVYKISFAADSFGGEDDTPRTEAR